MTADTLDEYIVKTFRMYAREKGIDLKSIALKTLESGKDIDDCETDFNWKLRDHVYDFKKVIGQYMADDVESAVLSSIELGDIIDLDDYFDDDGVCYNSKSKRSPGKKAPASRSVKRSFFPKGTTADQMAEAIAVELTKCGLDREYGPDFDVYDDCYWYMSTGDREDFVEWADNVRPECPRAAAMIEEAIAIFDDDGSFEAIAKEYARLNPGLYNSKSGRGHAPKRTSKGRAPAGKSCSRPSGKGAGKTSAKSRSPASKASKTKTAPAKRTKGARK